MFNLEDAITEWRRRMLAAGIQSPVPLEELELHLREEVERQINSGLPASEAFYLAVWNMGPATLMQTEFCKENAIHNWFGDDASVNRLVGLLWIAQGLWFMSNFAPLLGELLYMPSGMEWEAAPSTSAIKLAALGFNSVTSLPAPVVSSLASFLLLNSAGVLAGFCLFRGARLGRSAVKIIALTGTLMLGTLILLAPASGILTLPQTHFWCPLQIIFSLITIWLLRLSKKPKHSYV